MSARVPVQQRVRRVRIAAGLATGLLFVAGCDRPAPPKSWPAGTVLALDERPILASDVDEVSNWIALLEPRDSLEQLRRIALTNVVFPRLAAQAIDPAGREEALASARAWRHTLDTDIDVHAPLTGPALMERKGKMMQLGMEVWNAALHLEPGHWSDVTETAGFFHILRVKERDQAALPGLVEFTVEIYDFPYLAADQAHSLIDAQLDRSRLTFVDESWKSCVPTIWQYRLRGGTP